MSSHGHHSKLLLRVNCAHLPFLGPGDPAEPLRMGRSGEGLQGRGPALPGSPEPEAQNLVPPPLHSGSPRNCPAPLIKPLDPPPSTALMPQAKQVPSSVTVQWAYVLHHS